MKRALVVLVVSVLAFGGIAEAGKKGRGPGPGPEAGPAPEPGPLARECSLNSLLLDLPVEAPLSGPEIAGLRFSREEEKLARDVYLSLHETWDLLIFRKIAQSEREHMRGVKVLLKRYGIADPVGTNGVGVFTDGGLQTLYNQLVARGNQSLTDAFEVGLYIEEMDIFDLLGLLGSSDNQDIDTLYQNLMKGSRNHLRAFYRQLVRRDSEFEPTIHFLSTETFMEIVESRADRGLLDDEGEWICGGSRRGTLD